MGIRNFFSKKDKEDLAKGLEKTKESLINKISRSIAGKSKVDEDLLDKLEEALLSSDVGLGTTVKIIRKLEARVARDKYLGTEELYTILREKILSMHTIGGEATIHESPEDYADAETAYIKKITESYENYKKTDEYLEKKSEELAEKVVDEIGADEAEQSVEKLRSAISSQKEIHNAMKIHPRPIISEIDVKHNIEKHLNSFHDRLIRPFERIIGKKKKR